MADNIYLALTKLFNQGKKRVIITSGQAVVLHKLAVMSKDGDWIVRSCQESLDYILGVLEKKKAKYRFGAPLALSWLEQGWSSHFEFQEDNRRIRCDFFTKPARISDAELRLLWQRIEHEEVPLVGLRELALVKQTDRMKDYAVIGELARKMKPEDALLFSQSAKDIISTAAERADLVTQLQSFRPLLGQLGVGLDTLEELIDKERRTLMRKNEDRLSAYAHAARIWLKEWSSVETRMGGLPLLQAHAIMVAEATRHLPTQV